MADEENDRIYMIGGPTTANRYQVRYYQISTNSWHSPYDKTTRYTTYVSKLFGSKRFSDINIHFSRTALLLLWAGLDLTTGEL